MVIEKSYAIGATENRYTQGVFKDFSTAVKQVGKVGDYLWRLEDAGKGPVKAVRIRQWSQGEGEWIKLQNPSKVVDPRTDIDVVYVVGYPNYPDYKGVTSYLKMPDKVGEPVTRRGTKEDATEFATKEEAERNAEIWRKPPTGQMPAVVMSRGKAKEHKPITEREYAKGGVVDSDKLQRDMEVLINYKPASEKLDDFTSEVDLAYFENGLKIDKTKLDDCLVAQPEMLQKAGDRYAMALSRRDQAKDEIKQVEGRLYTQARSELESKGEKVSEAMIAARVNSHIERAAAVKKYCRLIEECQRWEGMEKSYRDRGYAIKALADLYASGYWSNSSVQDYRQKNAEYDHNQEVRRNAYRERNSR